jgi:hypothetical protein
MRNEVNKIIQFGDAAMLVLMMGGIYEFRSSQVV